MKALADASTPALAPTLPSAPAYAGVTQSMWAEVEAQRAAFGDPNDCLSQINRFPAAGVVVTACDGDCINDALLQADTVTLKGGTYLLSATVLLNGKTLMGAPGETVVLDASRVRDALELGGGSVLSNVRVLGAIDQGVRISGRGNLVYRVSVGQTGLGPATNEHGFGFVVEPGAAHNCLVSTEAYDGYDDAVCTDCQGGDAAFGYVLSEGAADNTLIDSHAYRNTGGGMVSLGGGSAYLYFSAFHGSGKTASQEAGKGTGVSLTPGSEGPKFYKTHVHDNLGNGFDNTGNAAQPVFVETHAWGNAGPGGNYAGITAPGGTTPQPQAASGVSPGPSRPAIGANIHFGGGDPASNQKLADIMSSRRLSTARMDFTPDADLANFRDQVLKLKAHGIRVETNIQTSYQWDHGCSPDLAFVEQDAYRQAATLVTQIMDVVQDFELLNEVSLRADTAADVPPNQGTPASGYADKRCYATLAGVLRGMSRAIVDLRASSGLPLKIILGAVSRDFGFLEFMQQQGVAFDIVGYHIYPWLHHALLDKDPWFGPEGGLQQLARFNKPVRINEFNCGEIYGAGYENTLGQTNTNACLQSIDKHLKGLLAQKVIDLESIHAYEITDRPAQAVPENRFGLMVDLDAPKLHLALFSAFAGGYVSAAEKMQLDALGLTSAPHASAAANPLIGANIHFGGGDAISNQKLADIMSRRRLAAARMDFTPDADLANFRDQVLRLQANGIRVQTNIQNSYQWDHRCNPDLAVVEQDSLMQTTTMVGKLMDIVQDFELLNDVSLRDEAVSEVPPYQGTPASGYGNKPCYQTLAAVLRGMSRAIIGLRESSGLPLKVILGGVSRDFGFLEFMRQQGVAFDIIGYPVYPWLQDAALNDDPWYGVGGAFQQLARFNKPVRISQFNCGEIYAADYDNLAGQPRTLDCLKSTEKHLASLLAQRVVPIESVHLYELTDRPLQAVPGNRFGLMLDLDHPKLQLALVSAWAGGYVSPAEALQLDALGLAGGLKRR